MDAPQQESGNDKSGKSKQKKFSVRVDFTPMVDMNMLLITFFMLCSTLQKPQTMEINMPADDKDLTEEQKNKVKNSLAVTLLLDKDDQVFYYEGQGNLEDPSSLKRTTYEPNGLRAFLQQRNATVVLKVRELREQRKNLALVPGGSEEANKAEYDRKVRDLKEDKNTPTVIIKATDNASYKNLVDALDEMQICNIGRYVIGTIQDTDKLYIQLATGRL